VAFAGAFLIAAGMGIGRFAYTPLLPGLQEALSWSVAQAGDVASANYLGYLLGAMLASQLVHRPQRASALLMGMFFSGLSTLVCMWISSYESWLAMRFLSGFASAFCFILGTAIVVEEFKRCGKPYLISTHFAGLSIGIIGSVVIIEIAKHYAYPVSMQWGVLGVCAFVMLGLSAVVFNSIPTLAENLQSSPAEQPEQSSSGLLRRLIIAYGLFGFGYVVTATFIIAIARQFENAVFLEPATWIIVGLVGAPSIYFWQLISRLFGVFVALRFAYTIEAIGVLLAGSANSPIAVACGGAMLGGTFMAITAMGIVAAREVSGASYDKAIAWMTISFGTGQLLGPAVAGRLAESTGSFAVPSALAAFLLLCGVFLLKGKGRSGRKTSTKSQD
jgi:predicted MFS family arabinose efflux permease